jgi:hypothetical protein
MREKKRKNEGEEEEWVAGRSGRAMSPSNPVIVTHSVVGGLT